MWSYSWQILSSPRGRGILAFSLIELLICIALISTLAAIVTPMYAEMMDDVRNSRSRMELIALTEAIDDYDQLNGHYPVTLDELEGRLPRTDPWGEPYQYLRIRESLREIGKSGRLDAPAGARKDRFMVPLNLDYDLYSKGKDRATVPPLTAAASHDDIIRAMEGGYFGLAKTY
jgi:general secretion pathway protein G